MLMMIMITGITARQATQTFDETLVSFKNYGFYLQPQKALRPINHQWSHVYIIDLPTLLPKEVYQGSPTMICRVEKPSPEESVECTLLARYQRTIHDIELKAYQMLNDSYVAFKEAFYTSVKDVSSVRTRRAWFDIIGKGLSVVFGLRTHQQMDTVYEAIKEIRVSQAQGFQAVANVSSKLASFMKLSKTDFDTIFRMFETFNKMSDNFNHEMSVNRHLIAGLEQHLVFSLQQSVEFSMELYQITQFRSALQAALNGKITPDLIPPNTIRTTLDAINQQLSRLHTPLYFVPQTPQAVYAGDFSL